MTFAWDENTYRKGQFVPHAPRTALNRGVAKSHPGLLQHHCNRTLCIACYGQTPDQSAVQPPSTTMADPVIKEDASEARNTTAPINSST